MANNNNNNNVKISNISNSNAIMWKPIIIIIIMAIS
jgi:hypothetical protein